MSTPLNINVSKSTPSIVSAESITLTEGLPNGAPFPNPGPSFVSTLTLQGQGGAKNDALGGKIIQQYVAQSSTNDPGLTPQIFAGLAIRPAFDGANLGSNQFHGANAILVDAHGTNNDWDKGLTIAGPINQTAIDLTGAETGNAIQLSAGQKIYFSQDGACIHYDSDKKEFVFHTPGGGKHWVKILVISAVAILLLGSIGYLLYKNRKDLM